MMLKKKIIYAMMICVMTPFSLFAGTKFILSIDGGGVRGIIPATFIHRFCLEVGKPPHDMFDLMAGTSSGGLLSLAYATGIDTKILEDLFFAKATTIFPQFSAQGLWGLFGTLNVKYPSAGLEGLLRELYQEKRLSETQVPVMVTTSDIEKDKPYLFKSWLAKENPQKDFFLWEVGRATTAAPSYFESTLLQTRDERYALIDGGVCMNNPTMAAFAEGKRLWPEDKIVILSIGTGNGAVSYPYEDAKRWGQPAWLFPLLHLTTDHVSKAVDYQAKQILREGSYFRFQLSLNAEDMPLDYTSQEHLQKLQETCCAAFEGFSTERMKLKELLVAAGKL